MDKRLAFGRIVGKEVRMKETGEVGTCEFWDRVEKVFLVSLESKVSEFNPDGTCYCGSHRKGVIFLSEMEKKLADNLAKAAAALPESKREFLLGYAEGVAAMTEAKGPAAPAVEDKPEEPAS